MNIILHKANERGGGDYGWLSTRHSFSFGNWYEPTRMGFGALRVLNDDTIAPESGFGTHAHSDMEIITIVQEGIITHKDSLGNIGIVPKGDVQVMSAGTGVEHSEYNDSRIEPLSLFQLWITPKKKGIYPRYGQKTFNKNNMEYGIELLVSPLTAVSDDIDTLTINQDAWIYRARLHKDAPIPYAKNMEEHGVYIFVIEGKAIVGGEPLEKRDAVGITDNGNIVITTDDVAEVLIIEVPMELTD